jgi:hypothetical protein
VLRVSFYPEPDWYPVAATCFFAIEKLPDYASAAELARRLDFAMREENLAMHLK